MNFFSLRIIIIFLAGCSVTQHLFCQAPQPYDWKNQQKYKGVEIKTTYVSMYDSVRLAVDVYLPENRKSNEKFPVIVHQTRYWRSPQLRWPFSMFSNGLLGKTGDLVTAFVEHGYVVVNVDVRGSGASFGSRTHPWSGSEIQDGYEILEWIARQEWSSGFVGSTGFSYSGTTAEFLAGTGHPSLKAVMLNYCLYDVYDDISFPGGIHHKYFTDNWGKANAALDKDIYPQRVSLPICW